jgi:hypothetical protein
MSAAKKTPHYPTYTRLTDKVLTYQNRRSAETGPEFSEFGERDTVYEELYRFIYFFPIETNLLPEEHACEFLLYLNPLLDNILLRFRYQGVPFEVYMKNIIYWKIKSFHTMKRREQYQEKACTACLAEEVQLYPWESAVRPEDLLFSAEDPGGYGPVTKRLKDDIARRSSVQRRILIITLTVAPYLSGEQTEKAAELLSMPPERLLAWTEQLRETARGTLSKIEKLRMRRNSIYAALISEQFALSHQPPGSREYCTLLEQISTKRNRLNRLNREIASVRATVNYRHISQLLDIPLGTVSSTVFYGKRYLLELLAQRSG